MKKKIILVLSLIAIIGFSNAQNVIIPDSNFKNALLAHGSTILGQGISTIDTSNDGEIQVSEAQNYTGVISVFGQSINNLIGIEAFTAATKLWCNQNSLTSLDLSQNTTLLEVNCRNNSLNSLILGQNIALSELECRNNQLTSLDVSQNTALTELFCANNQLISLDVSQNSNLTQLDCFDNQLTSLNLANGNNGINATELYHVDAHNNPNLTCIQHDAGFSPDWYPSISNGWQKDATASWSVHCPYTSCSNFVTIPDNNFKNALLAHGSTITGAEISTIDIDGDGQICVTEAQAYTGKLNLNNQNISDLTGIEAFTAATKLWCSNNSLSSLDLSQDTALTEVFCQYNNLTSLTLGQNTVLTRLNCQNNNLTSLDISQTTNLTELYCLNNSLISLDLNQNTSLTKLYCNDNNLSNLDVSQNTLLTNIHCHNNTINSLVVSASTSLEELNCNNNNISNLNLSQNTALVYLYCNDNNLTSLDLSQINSLLNFRCDNNSISNLDLSQNNTLSIFSCINNNLSSLNLANGNNTNIVLVWAYDNSNLNCIQHDVNFDPTTATSAWVKDAAASWSDDCNSSSVLVSSITVQGQGGITTITNSGGTLQMEATVLPANASDGSYNWSVDNQSGAALIDANGLLTAQTDGTVIVRATANDGSGVVGSATIGISNQTAAIENLALENIQIYPNPVNDELFIDSGKERITSVSFVSVSGKVLKTQSAKHIESMDLSNLPQGIYFVKVSTEKGIATKKIIKK